MKNAVSTINDMHVIVDLGGERRATVIAADIGAPARRPPDRPGARLRADRAGLHHDHAAPHRPHRCRPRSGGQRRQGGRRRLREGRLGRRHPVCRADERVGRRRGLRERDPRPGDERPRRHRPAEPGQAGADARGVDRGDPVPGRRADADRPLCRGEGVQARPRHRRLGRQRRGGPFRARRAAAAAACPRKWWW